MSSLELLLEICKFLVTGLNNFWNAAFKKLKIEDRVDNFSLLLPLIALAENDSWTKHSFHTCKHELNLGRYRSNSRIVELFNYLRRNYLNDNFMKKISDDEIIFATFLECSQTIVVFSLVLANFSKYRWSHKLNRVCFNFVTKRFKLY